MGFDADDQEIIRLLTKLKEAEPAYPQDLLAARRQRFLQQMGEIGLGIGAGMAAREALKNGNGSAASTTTSTMSSTLLEAALVAAIILEAGTVAYFYRDKVSDALKTVVRTAGVQVQEGTPPAQTIASEAPIIASPSPASTHTPALPTATPIPPGLTVTQTLTPEPGVADITDPVTEPPKQIQSTPRPNDNNGNHYGQTPKPERTIENNGNNDRQPQDDNPPRDDQGPPPNKDPKPTKA